MRKSLPRGVPWLAAAILLVTACEREDMFGPEGSGVVVTVVDMGPALASARTFALPDTIVEVPVSTGTISHAADHAIVESVRTHLQALGWRDVTGTSGAAPDVVVLVAASTRIQTGVAYTDWYGAWGYLPYWGAGISSTWAWGVPVGIPYAYQAGTVLITMLDLRAPRAQLAQRQSGDVDERIPLLWAAALDGVVTDATNTAARALDGIDQAFAQSTYLRVP
jgi:hypothetical protein